MIHSVKYLLEKREAMSSDPSSHVKEMSVVICLGRQEDPRALLTSQTKQIGKFQG